MLMTWNDCILLYTILRSSRQRIRKKCAPIRRFQLPDNGSSTAWYCCDSSPNSEFETPEILSAEKISSIFASPDGSPSESGWGRMYPRRGARDEEAAHAAPAAQLCGEFCDLRNFVDVDIITHHFASVRSEPRTKKLSNHRERKHVARRQWRMSHYERKWFWTWLLTISLFTFCNLRSVWN